MKTGIVRVLEQAVGESICAAGAAHASTAAQGYMPRHGRTSLGRLLMLIAYLVAGPTSMVFFLPTSARAQQTTSPVAGQTQNGPESMLSACAAVMGASKAELPVIAQGTLNVAGAPESQHVVIKSQGLHLFRQEQSGPSGTEAWVVKEGVGFRSNASQKEKLAGHSTRYFRPDHLPALACAPDLGKFIVTLEGPEQVRNRTAYHLKLVAKPLNMHANGVDAILSEYHVYVDQQSFQVLKTSTFVFSPQGLQNRSTWETYYGDYRTIDGIAVPFHIENYISGQKFRDIILSDVQVGVSLNNAEFE